KSSRVACGKGMNIARNRLLALLVPGLVLGLWVALGAFLFWLTLDSSEKVSVATQFGPVLAPRAMLLVLWWLAASGFSAWILHKLFQALVASPLRLAEETRVLASDPSAPDLEIREGWVLRRLAEAINSLAEQR